MDEIRPGIQELAQELAEAASGQVHPPGAHVALRVGRQRRRRRQAGGVSLLAVVLVAGVVGLPRLGLPTDTAGALGSGSTLSPAGAALAPVVCDPGRAPGGGGTGAGSLVASGESQGIAWRVTLAERENRTPLGPELSDEERAVMDDLREQGLDKGYAVLQLHVGTQDGGRLNSPLPTSGATEAGKVVNTPSGPMRPLIGFVGTPQNRETGIRIRYQSPPGTAEACFVPTAERLKLHGRLFVAFIPATAKWPEGDFFDARGKRVGGWSLGCSSPPTDLMPACETGRDPAEVRSGTTGQGAHGSTSPTRDGR
jgi:hypothetical protein